MFIEVIVNRNGAWFWRLIAENKEILAVSESYSSKGKCVQTVKQVSNELGLTYNPTTNLATRKD